MLLLHLTDKNPDVVRAWQTEFANEPNVSVSQGDILDQTADAVVSPANSFGYMDGGIDLHYSQFFGQELEERLQSTLGAQYFGELPVGQAVIISTNHTRIPFLVSAPTMRVPSSISRTANVYLAFRAALIAVRRHNDLSQQHIATLLVPGLGTGVGEVPPSRAARQMKLAYSSIVKEGYLKSRNAGSIWGEHHELLNC